VSVRRVIEPSVLIQAWPDSKKDRRCGRASVAHDTMNRTPRPRCSLLPSGLGYIRVAVPHNHLAIRCRGSQLPSRLLRPHCQRSGSRRAAKQRGELAPSRVEHGLPSGTRRASLPHLKLQPKRPAGPWVDQSPGVSLVLEAHNEAVGVAPERRLAHFGCAGPGLRGSRIAGSGSQLLSNTSFARPGSICGPISCS
jgi:hypothetical protein